MKKNFALVLMCIICSTAIGCNSVPADMFPKSVGAFQLKEVSAPRKDKKGDINFDAKYISPESKEIGCHGFDASSEEEAVTTVDGSGLNDDAHPLIPILDKTGKQIGIKLLYARPGEVSLLWNIRKRAYWCESEATEKTLEEFFNNWQSQTFK